MQCTGVDVTVHAHIELQLTVGTLANSLKKNIYQWLKKLAKYRYLAASYTFIKIGSITTEYEKPSFRFLAINIQFFRKRDLVL